MTSLLGEFRKLAESVSDTPESVGMDLRIQFSTLLERMLQHNQWSQAELFRRTGIHQPEISAYMHADDNITVDQIGRILHACKARIRMQLILSDETAKDDSNGKEEGGIVPIASTLPDASYQDAKATLGKANVYTEGGGTGG